MGFHPFPSMHSSASIRIHPFIPHVPRTPARFETHRISGFPMLAAVCHGSTGTPPDRDPTSSAISLSTHWPCMPLERTNRGHASPPAGNSKGCDTGIQSIPGHLPLARLQSPIRYRNTVAQGIASLPLPCRNIIPQYLIYYMEKGSLAEEKY